MNPGIIINIDTAKIVKELLEKEPELRDNDNRLIANVWALQMKKPSLAKMCAVDLMRMIAGGFFKAPESITRCRRKIQEECEELRGKRYKERKQLEQVANQESQRSLGI